MLIRLAGEVAESVVDGPGIRYTVFTQGCLHNCPGCHNPLTHPLDLGYLKENDEIIKAIKANPLVSGLTISGGEPFLQVEPVLDLVLKTKEISKDIIIYTGYTFEELINLSNENILKILKNTDYLIDGRFEIDKRSLELLFKGSSNQRIIDLKKTFDENKIVLKDFSLY